MKKEKLNIKINDSFRIEADRYNYILIESYLGKPGKDKHGNPTEPKIQTHESYFPSLEQCIRAVRDMDIKRSDTIDQIFDALQRSYALDKVSAESISD